MALNMQHIAGEHNRLVNQKNEQANNVNYIKLGMGDTYIRILPPYDSKGYVFGDFWLHFLKDEENNWRTFRCSRSIDGRCPICERSKMLSDSPNENEKTLGKNIRGQHKYIYNALDKDFKSGILTVGPQLHGEIVGEIHELGLHNIDPTDYNTGHFLKITKTGGQWNNTKYKARAERQGSIVPAEVVQNIKLINLEEFYVQYSYDELCQVLNGNFDPRGLNKPATTTVPAQTQGYQPQAVNSAPQVSAPAQQIVNQPVSQPQQAPVTATPVYTPPSAPTIAPTTPLVQPASVQDAKRLLGMA